MKGRVIFLLEEPSMKALLDDWLPRLFPGWTEGQHFQCIKHEGKSDLENSFPRKLRAWREPNVRFVVVRDNDGANCADLKARYARLCLDAGRPDTLIRLVCQELESWYLGDLTAVAEAFQVNVDTTPLQRRFARPDEYNNAKQELQRLVPGYQKIGGSRKLAPYLDATRNRSASLQVFLSGLQRIVEQMKSSR